MRTSAARPTTASERSSTTPAAPRRSARSSPPSRTAAALSPKDVYRFAFCLPAERFGERFGEPPRRPPKGGSVDLSQHDLTGLGRLTPHPVYAWMRWVQILSPTPAQYVSLRPLLEESLELVKTRWARKKAG